MITVIKGRREGKTTELIKMAHERGGYIVCLNRTEAQRVFEHAMELGMLIRLPITFHEFLRGDYRTKGVSEVYIDNLEIALAQMPLPVYAISLTPQPEPHEQN